MASCLLLLGYVLKPSSTLGLFPQPFQPLQVLHMINTSCDITAWDAATNTACLMVLTCRYLACLISVLILENELWLHRSTYKA